jgi:hypothetical protein
MGALKGSIAVRRYAVLDPLPQDLRKRLVRGLRAHAFLPLDPATSDLDRSAGWVSILDGEDADLHPEKVFFVAPGGEQLRVSLRIDVLKPPTSEVRRQLGVKVAEREATEGRRLSARERRGLREEITRTLRLRAFPRVKIVDAVWHLDAKRVWLWSQTKGANELFLDLFARSFNLRIEPEGAARWAHAIADARTLERLLPTRELWTGFEGVRPLTGNVTDDEAA